MKRSTKIIAAVVVVMGGISVLGCSIDTGLDDFDDLWDPDPCTGSSPDLNGVWEITGSGKRSDCREEFLNTDRFTLGSLEIPIVYDANTGEMALGQASYADSFEIRSSLVDRACVEFTTVEIVGDQAIEYRWEGNARSDRYVEGEFSGSGPAGCEVKGTFTMSR